MLKYFTAGGNYSASIDSKFFLLDHLYTCGSRHIHQIFAHRATVNSSLLQGSTVTGFSQTVRPDFQNTIKCNVLAILIEQRGYHDC